MTLFWLVRHGEAAASWSEHPDPGLSDLGHRQAQDTAAELAGDIDQGVRIVSSPKARAQETAAPLAARLHLQPEINEVFNEIQSPVALADRQQWLRNYMTQRWDEQPESILKWRGDILASIRGLSRPTVIFTHFLVINAVLGHIAGSDKTLTAWPDNGSHHAFQIKDGVIELLSLGRQMATVVN